MAGYCTRRLSILMLTAVMAVQLTFAVGHVHTVGPLPHQHDVRHHQVVCAEGDASLACNVTDQDHAHNTSPGVGAHADHRQTRGESDPSGHTAPGEHHSDCELCWVLSILSGFVLPILACSLLANCVSLRLSFSRPLQRSRARASELYRARAPPSMIPA